MLSLVRFFFFSHFSFFFFPLTDFFFCLDLYPNSELPLRTDGVIGSQFAVMYVLPFTSSFPFRFGEIKTD